MANIASLVVISNSLDTAAKFMRIMEKEGVTCDDLFRPVNDRVARRNLAAYLKAGCPKLGDKLAADNSIIRVDRSMRPSYPDWVKTVMHPELEPTGPAEYDIRKVKQWLHDGQKGGKWIEGKKIYAHLKETDTLKTCLGLRDLEEIQKKGIAFFREYFQGKAVFGWKSVVLGRDGRLDVPYLYEGGGEVVMRWDWLDDGWYDFNPALRFAS